MMKKTPSKEQNLAIQHCGGLLLEAGAGSGKTFVIIEHLLFLIEQFFKQLPLKLSSTEKELEFRRFLSSLVVMTFTRKAAYEMETRLKEKVEAMLDECRDLNEGDYYQLLFKNITAINVSTIHSFCFRLISQGLIVNLPTDLSLEDSWYLKEKIRSLSANYFVSLKNNTNCQRVHTFFLLHFDQFTEAISNIFAEVHNRQQWLKTIELLDRKEKIEKLQDILDYFIKNDPLQKVLHPSFTLTEIAINEKTGLYSFLKSLFDKINHGINSLDDLISFFYFFHSTPRLPPVKKDAHPLLVAYWDEIKLLKGKIKDNWYDVFSLFQKSQLDFYVYTKFIQDLLIYIETNYLLDKKISYSDLEYYVIEYLSFPENAERVKKSFSYFIVDEFQDTSRVQFQLLKLLIGDDFSRLFAVGDIKQSIYGFRGGEIQVFKECQKLIPRYLSLQSNYRSHPEIVKFNNTLFIELLKNNVEVKKQKAQRDDSNAEGLRGVFAHKISIPPCDYVKKNDNSLDLIEAFAIVESLKKNYFSFLPNEKVVVLFKNLLPLNELIPLLVAENFVFTTQKRIKLAEDPFVGMFNYLLEAYLADKYVGSDLNFLLFKMQSFFSTPTVDQEKIKIFFAHLPFIGPWNAYLEFVHGLHLVNPYYEENMGKIEKICQMSNGDTSASYEMLQRYLDESYSVELSYGTNSQQVFSLEIMTVHSSKGLEFDHVILGGIYSNGKSYYKMPLIGKTPWSFKWDVADGETIENPFLIVESLEEKKRERAESLRLFYVACTRAQQSLHFMQIELLEQNIAEKVGANSWYHFIPFEQPILKNEKLYDGEFLDEKFFSLQNTVMFDNKLEHSEKMLDKKEWILPQSQFAYVPEMAVTRLSSLAECPRKLFLGHMLNYDEKSLELLDKVTPLKNELLRDVVSKSEENQYAVHSTSERGTRIHRFLSQWIQDGKINFADEDRDIINPLLKKLKKLQQQALFYSEYELKFSFHKMMISATPDLIVLPKNYDEKSLLEIWDFKTGTHADKTHQSYWLQLYFYAYAAYELGFLDKNHSIKCVLIFIDQACREEERIMSFKQLVPILDQYWKQIPNFHLMKREYCSSCQFLKICHLPQRNVRLDD